MNHAHVRYSVDHFSIEDLFRVDPGVVPSVRNWQSKSKGGCADLADSLRGTLVGLRWTIFTTALEFE